MDLSKIFDVKSCKSVRKSLTCPTGKQRTLSRGSGDRDLQKPPLSAATLEVERWAEDML